MKCANCHFSINLTITYSCHQQFIYLIYVHDYRQTHTCTCICLSQLSMSFNCHKQIAIYIFRIFVFSSSSNCCPLFVCDSSSVDRTSASTQRSKWGTPNRQQCSLPRKKGYRAQYQGSCRGMLTAEGIVQRRWPVAGSASHVEYSAYVHIHTSVHIYTSRKRDKTLSPLAHRKSGVERVNIFGETGE